MKNKHILTIALLILIIILVFYFSLSNKNSTEEIKIGFIGSLTGLDPSYGESMKGGVEIALDEINKTGGVNGKNIKVIYEDGKCIDSKSAVSAAQKLISIDRVKLIVGGGCSNEVLSIVPIVNESKIIMLSAGASSPDVSGSSRYVFRNAPSDSYTGFELANRVYQSGYKNVVIISDQTEYSMGFRRPFISQFKSLGGEVVLDEEIVPNNLDYRSELVKIKQLKFDALFINPNTPKIAGILTKQARELGIGQQIFIAYHATPDFLATAGDKSEGVIAINTPIPDNVLAQNVLEKFRKNNNHDTVYPYNTIAAYDDVKILAEAIKQVGMDTDKISDYLSQLRSYDGGLGKYGFDKNGDIIGIKFRYQQVVNGQFVVVE